MELRTETFIESSEEGIDFSNSIKHNQVKVLTIVSIPCYSYL